MPELPEVETIRRQLLQALPGRLIAEVEEADLFMLRDVTEEELRRRLPGKRVESVQRRGKFLILPLSDSLYLTIHLGMTGQLLILGDEAQALTHVRFSFRLLQPAAGGPPAGTGASRMEGAPGGPGTTTRLVFRDVRKFGRVHLTEGAPAARLAPMGPDALEDEWTAAELAESLRGRRAPLKAFLLDQRRLAGIGNIYADEILWSTRLSPLRPAGSLSSEEIAVLAREIRSRLAEGVRLRGCSISDFMDTEGRAGGFQEVLQAYGRHGEACSRCGTTLVRTIVAGRGTAYCPRCQR